MDNISKTLKLRADWFRNDDYRKSDFPANLIRPLAGELRAAANKIEDLEAENTELNDLLNTFQKEAASLQKENFKLREENTHLREERKDAVDHFFDRLRQITEQNKKINKLQEEKAELIEALKDIIDLAEMAMEMANNDGGEFDIDDYLSEARAALNGKEASK